MSQGEGQVTSLQQFFLHVRSDLTHIVMFDVTQMALILTKIINDSFQKHEIQLVYLDELYATVNNHIERFLNSCTFYFIRSTKGEMKTVLQFKHLV